MLPGRLLAFLPRPRIMSASVAWATIVPGGSTGEEEEEIVGSILVRLFLELEAAVWSLRNPLRGTWSVPGYRLRCKSDSRQDRLLAAGTSIMK